MQTVDTNISQGLNVAIIENNAYRDGWAHERAEKILRELGYAVIPFSVNLEQVLNEVIPQLESLEVCFALIDSFRNVSTREKLALDESNDTKIADRMREQAPSVTTIGFARESKQNNVDVRMGSLYFNKGILREAMEQAMKIASS